jgi:tRNA threonylcarbamoyl adenosine modification protein (Sua5/YciO/YrdC/YwlC family)
VTAESNVGDGLDGAVEALRAGAVVGIPTDTVYGLAADAGRGAATDAVFVLKRRPPNLELPVLVADVAQAEDLAAGGLPDLGRLLVGHFWPGPLTIVVERRGDLDWAIGGDGRTIGLRCPAHAVARTLCRRVGPLATTSANRHGEPPLTTAADVTREFGGAVAVVVDGGVCDGTSSTVVDVTGGTVRCIRDGAVPWAEVLAVAAPG